MTTTRCHRRRAAVSRPSATTSASASWTSHRANRAATGLTRCGASASFSADASLVFRSSEVCSIAALPNGGGNCGDVVRIPHHLGKCRPDQRSAPACRHLEHDSGPLPRRKSAEVSDLRYLDVMWFYRCPYDEANLFSGVCPPASSRPEAETATERQSRTIQSAAMASTSPIEGDCGDDQPLQQG